MNINFILQLLVLRFLYILEIHFQQGQFLNQEWICFLGSSENQSRVAMYQTSCELKSQIGCRWLIITMNDIQKMKEKHFIFLSSKPKIKPGLTWKIVKSWWYPIKGFMRVNGTLQNPGLFDRIENLWDSYCKSI